ncbi:hypothetical protein TNCV_3737021 [Trichonephila clavipes]|nr:hypothetical protein TNCV_3737021 [Trichonephila clavipes]
MDVVDFFHQENPSTWTSAELANLGVQGKRLTNYATQVDVTRVIPPLKWCAPQFEKCYTTDPNELTHSEDYSYTAIVLMIVYLIMEWVKIM